MPERNSDRVALAVVWGLSLLRVVLAAVFWFLSPGWRLAAVFAASASDAADGYLARRFGVATWWGSVADAGTDKLFTLTVMVVLTAEGKLAWWQLGLLLTRDIAVLGLIAVLAANRRWPVLRELGHRLLGKAATAAQFLLLLALIVAPDAAGVTVPLFALAAGVTVLSAVDYLWVLLPRVRAAEAA